MIMNKLTWQMVALIAVLAATAVVLTAVAHVDAAAVVGVLGVLAGVGGAGAAVGQVAGKVDDVHQENVVQTQRLATIEKNTNGLSAQERQDIANRAATAAVALLKDR